MKPKTRHVSEIVQRVLAQIPWRSNIALLDKLDNSSIQEQADRRACPERLQETHRCRRLGNPDRQTPAGRAEREPPDRGGDRSGTRQRRDDGMNGATELAAKIRTNLEELEV